MANTFATNDLVEVTIYCTGGDQVSANVIHYRVSSTTGTSATDATFAVAMDTAFSGPLKSVMANSARYEGVKVQIIKPTRRPATTTSTGAGAGTGGADMLPPGTAAVISKLTNVASREKRGRFYTPFQPETGNNANGLPNAGQLGLIAAIANILDDQVTLGLLGNQAVLNPCVYSRKAGTTEDITGTRINQRWGVQRRRSGQKGSDVLPPL